MTRKKNSSHNYLQDKWHWLNRKMFKIKWIRMRWEGGVRSHTIFCGVFFFFSFPCLNLAYFLSSSYEVKKNNKKKILRRLRAQRGIKWGKVKHNLSPPTELSSYEADVSIATSHSASTSWGQSTILPLFPADNFWTMSNFLYSHRNPVNF